MAENEVGLSSGITFVKNKPTLKSLVAYSDLIKRLSEIEKNLLKNYINDLQCKRGCAECCELLSVFSVEADFIQNALAKLPGATLEALKKKKKVKECPLLLDGVCPIYDSRPVICKTHGYPLLMDGRVTFCPKNFKKTRKIKANCLTDLSRLNLALAAINHCYLEEKGSGSVRVSLRKILKKVS